MAISSCSIIHYTDEFDKIESIFNDSAFRLKYCAERFVAIGYKKYEFAIAMVSFCDIPLSDYKKHFKNLSNQSGKNAKGNLGYYGDYGIGLSKKWAVKNKLNPVLYFDSNSSVAKGLVKNTERILKGISIDDSSVWSLIPCYAKNQKGDLIRNGGVVKRDYIFYDEREWRYVPTKIHIGNKAVMLNLSDYESDKPGYNQSIGFHSLTFSPSDISYIILRDDSEILLFKDVIRNKYANDPKLVDLLLTKIITSEQIQLDF